MPSFGLGRVLLASSAAIGTSCYYYWSKVEPAVNLLWLKGHHGIPFESPFLDAFIPPFVGCLCWLVLAICINQYVNKKQLSFTRLTTMSLELWLMTLCLCLPNVEQYSQAHFYKFACDQLFNFGMILLLTLILGWKRCSEDVDDDIISNPGASFHQNGFAYLPSKNGYAPVG